MSSGAAISAICDRPVEIPVGSDGDSFLMSGPLKEDDCNGPDREDLAEDPKYGSTAMDIGQRVSRRNRSPYRSEGDTQEGAKWNTSQEVGQFGPIRHFPPNWIYSDKSGPKDESSDQEVQVGVVVEKWVFDRKLVYGGQKVDVHGGVIQKPCEDRKSKQRNEFRMEKLDSRRLDRSLGGLKKKRDRSAHGDEDRCQIHQHQVLHNVQCEDRVVICCQA